MQRKTKVEIHKVKIMALKRIDIISKEKIMFKPYLISKLDRNILLDFNNTTTSELSKKLNVNRSYIYATIVKFKSIYTKDEVTSGEITLPSATFVKTKGI